MTASETWRRRDLPPITLAPRNQGRWGDNGNPAITEYCKTCRCDTIPARGRCMFCDEPTVRRTGR